ncbi:MAG: hypothetical protein ACREAB_19810 [Blastocatellia bacterium]
MPAISRKFDSYKVTYESFSNGQPGATITCYLQNKNIGRIDFYDAVPASRKNRIEDDLIILVFRITSFSDVLAILRSKKTYRLVLETDLPSFPIGYVAT